MFDLSEIDFFPIHIVSYQIFFFLSATKNLGHLLLKFLKFKKDMMQRGMNLFFIKDVKQLCFAKVLTFRIYFFFK